MKRILILVVAIAAAMAAVAAESLSRDSLARLAARMLIVGFKGDTVTADNPVVGYLTEQKVGGIILFDVDLTGSRELGSRNVTGREQLRQLTADLRRLAGYPLVIAVDQEGGLVQRLKPRYGFEGTPSARALGATGSVDSTYRRSAMLARQLADYGINLNLAPEVDIHSDSCPVIGGLDRAYSANPDSVALHAAAAVDAFHAAGVLATLKHFPGHGSATSDSHYGLTDVTTTWSPDELIPFKRLIDGRQADAIMTAHIFNRRLDPDYPATLSRAIITGILREQMGYDGVVITDDLYMQGIIDNYDIERALVLAINAGADMIIVGNNITTGFEPDRPARLVEMIVSAVERGDIDPARLLDANRHIDALFKNF
ncbi:MAG: glycoside hydrolase family 3 protein [Muribaculaceae bacterium]|nr:glycoside hydrolase family 3 protein [Muribaculaceae bacterium]